MASYPKFAVLQNDRFTVLNDGVGPEKLPHVKADFVATWKELDSLRQRKVSPCRLCLANT